MEPKVYIQFHKNGNIRRYKNQLPPAENGPFVEETAGVAASLSSAKKSAKKHEWKIYAISSAMGAVGALIVELIKHFVCMGIL